MARRGMKTIRGAVEIDVNSRPVETLIFNYESPDRTRGWEVDSAFIWISDVLSPTAITSDVNLNLVANLATDTGSAIPGGSLTVNLRGVTDCTDNRSIAWAQKQWLARNTNDVYIPNAMSLTGCDFLVDLERIVTNELYLNAGIAQAGGGDVLNLRVCYMIVLKEISLSPTQSLLQQLKGIGQDVDN